ncbi:MAG: YbhB/YbcL family Raf kinase inhibitor-like protein [Myxococcota bacterium]
MLIQSSAFDPDGEIPARYTCEGDDTSPPLRWYDVPEGAKSLVLIMDDPDAPDPKAPQMTFVHWVLYNLPPEDGGLTEHVTPTRLPEGTRQGTNSWKRTGYGGPCPPIGRHRYFFKLFALDETLEDLEHPTSEMLQRAMEGHVLEEAEMIGTYEKKGG